MNFSFNFSPFVAQLRSKGEVDAVTIDDVVVPDDTVDTLFGVSLFVVFNGVLCGELPSFVSLFFSLAYTYTHQQDHCLQIQLAQDG